MLEFAACFFLVGITIAVVGYLIFTLLARQGLIRNAEDETRRLEAQLAREREAGAREASLKIRVEDLEGASMKLAAELSKLGMKIEDPKVPAGMDPEIMGELPGGYRG